MLDGLEDRGDLGKAIVLGEGGEVGADDGELAEDGIDDGEDAGADERGEELDVLERLLGEEEDVEGVLAGRRGGGVGEVGRLGEQREVA